MTLVVAALVVACILSCRLLVRSEVGDEEQYWVGDTVPLIRAAALREVFDLSGEDREENRLLAGPEGSAEDRTEERPGTVFMGEEEDAVPLEPPITDLYGRDELYMFREDLGEVGGVIAMDDRSRRALPPPGAVIGEVLADNAASPFTEIESGTLFPGEARREGVTWDGYWACWTTVFIGEEMVLYERMGEAMSLTDLTEDAGDPGMLVLTGEADVIDQTDFSGEAEGVLDDELESEPNPDLA